MTFDDLARAYEYGSALVGLVRDDVQHHVNAVAKVNVNMPGWSPHGCVTLCTTHAAVTGAVVRVAIGLDLGDAQYDVVFTQKLAEKLRRDHQCVTREERLRNHSRHEYDCVSHMCCAQLSAQETVECRRDIAPLVCGAFVMKHESACLVVDIYDW